MLGGPILSALAALRTGCGLARLAVPEAFLPSALAAAPVFTGIALHTDHTGDLVPHVCAPRIDGLMAESQAVVVGPGLGVSPGASAAVLRVVNGPGTGEQTPVVVDADALNNLAALTDYPKELRVPCVLTPHVGEFKRLAATLGITQDPAAPSSREEAAQALAQKLGAVVVLKSSATVVTDGLRAWTHDEPNALLATAGSGDVLAGVIASLIAQHHRTPILAGSRTISSETRGGISLFDAACAGVRAHALAAKAWGDANAGVDSGMLASDLLEYLPRAVGAIRS